MRENLRSGVIAVVVLVLLSGCRLTHEPIRYRDDYFHPVTSPPERGAVMVSSNDVNLLKSQLQQANQTIARLLDSLNAMQRYTGQLLTSTRTLVGRVTELESKESLAINKQKDLELSVASLKTENQDITRQLNELRKRVFAGTVNAEPQIVTRASITSSLLDEYEEGVRLYQQKKYDEARSTFGNLLGKGIDESLADNCEYWIGECHFAQRDIRTAITHFQKVLTMDSANKKVDAYFMLGKSYEETGDKVKARWAYEELNLLYPDNAHARYVRSRLQILNRELKNPSPAKKQKKSST